MFGYVIPPKQSLSQEEYKSFTSTYCGLCHTMGEIFGFSSRLFLSFDITFLALLTACKPFCCHKACVVHPVKKCEIRQKDQSLITCSYISAILTYWQINDGIQDSKGIRKLKYKFAKIFALKAYKKAKDHLSEFDTHVQKKLADLKVLEDAHCNSMDKVADLFAQILSDCSGLFADVNLSKRRILQEILYHLGRWIYLLDAVDDLKKDLKSGNYNPIIYRYHLDSDQLSDEQVLSLKGTLQASISSIARAFELGEFDDKSLIEKIIYTALPSVQDAVFRGDFVKQKKSRLEYHIE